MRDDEPEERGGPRRVDDRDVRTDSLDMVLHRIFGAALDLTTALQYVEDWRAATHIRAAVELLDQTTRDIRLHSLEHHSGAAADTELGRTPLVAFHDAEDS